MQSYQRLACILGLALSRGSIQRTVAHATHILARTPEHDPVENLSFNISNVTRDDKVDQALTRTLFVDLHLSPAFLSVLSRRNASTIAVKPMPDDMPVFLEPIS